MWIEAGWAIKLTGAKLGAILSLVLMPPKTIRDFMSRFSFSVGMGYFFAEDIQDRADIESLMSAAVITALMSWFVATFLVALLTKLDVPNLVTLLKEFRK